MKLKATSLSAGKFEVVLEPRGGAFQMCSRLPKARSVDVMRGGKPVWSLKAPGTRLNDWLELERFTYGEVPKGFEQVGPAAAALAEGDEVRVVVHGDSTGEITVKLTK